MSGILASGAALMGVTDGSAAAAGVVGQIIQSTASGVTLTSATPVNITSITLTPGDWDIYGSLLVTLSAGTTATIIVGSLSLTTGTVAGITINESYFELSSATYTGPGAGVPIITAIPNVVNSVSVNTIYYLVAQANFAVSTASAGGLIFARRVR